MSDRISIASPAIDAAEQGAVAEVLDSGYLADGPKVRAFEDEFADYCGAARGVATSNGTTALHAALEAVGVGPGDNVVTTPFSFVATANTIRFAGGIPIFADIDPETYTIDPDSVEALVETHSVSAIVAVHLYGCPAEMDRLVEIADEYDIALVEDAAQAHGAEYRGQRVGSIGDVATFSFYPTKNMTTGEGGMITTDDEEIARRAASFVNHGREESGYKHVSLGHNFRLTSMAAAIGLEQLQKLPSFTEARRQNAARLDDVLADANVATPVERDHVRHVYHQYTIRCDDRETLSERLDDAGIDSAVYYPTPIHKQPAYDGFDGEAPRADRAADRVLSLPVHPEVSKDDIDRIGRVLKEVLA
ncbi:DegT/DnrJ/EryC1/StrS family aminotransferase (plasmid) [Haloferacaceae archaeon DSL9]